MLKIHFTEMLKIPNPEMYSLLLRYGQKAFTASSSVTVLGSLSRRNAAGRPGAKVKFFKQVHILNRPQGSRVKGRVYTQTR